MINNKYASSSRLSHDDRQLVNDLQIKQRTPSTHGNNKAIFWNHFGHLYTASLINWKLMRHDIIVVHVSSWKKRPE